MRMRLAILPEHGQERGAARETNKDARNLIIHWLNDRNPCPYKQPVGSSVVLGLGATSRGLLKIQL